jgi:transcriptional regulator with XRE-family HTH domain
VSREQVQAFGRSVERHRTRQGLTREELAKRGSPGALSGGYIKLVENMDPPTKLPGNLFMSNPSLNNAFEIARALGVPLSVLVEGIGPDGADAPPMAAE